MKYLIILGDGMADEPIASLGGKTPLQAANKPCIDKLASEGACGRFVTVPDGYQPGSEIANLGVLGCLFVSYSCYCNKTIQKMSLYVICVL